MEQQVKKDIADRFSEMIELTLSDNMIQEAFEHVVRNSGYNAGSVSDDDIWNACKNVIIQHHGLEICCNKCGSKVVESDLEEYPYFCIECDENMFGFETHHLNTPIPELDHFSGSWVVSRKKDGSVIGEFYDIENVKKFNTKTCKIETALQYLQRINRKIEEKGAN